MSLEGIDRLLEVSHVLYNERMMELIKENKKLKEKIICMETKRTIYMCYDFDMLGKFDINNTSFLFDLSLKEVAEKYILIFINRIRQLINNDNINISHNFI